MITILNLVCQIDESQHMAEERVVINYTDSEKPNEPKTEIVNISSLSDSEQKKYTAIKELFISKISTEVV